LGYSLKTWIRKLGLESYIDYEALQMSNLVYRDDKNIWRSNYKTGKKSSVLFSSIVYKKALTPYEKAYYVYLASIIPVYSDQAWIPKQFIEEENIKRLINFGYIEPYLEGYILPREKEDYL